MLALMLMASWKGGMSLRVSVYIAVRPAPGHQRASFVVALLCSSHQSMHMEDPCCMGGPG